MRNINEFSLELSASSWYVKGVFHLCTSTFTLYLCLNYSNTCFVEMSVFHFKTSFGGLVSLLFKVSSEFYIF